MSVKLYKVVKLCRMMVTGFDIILFEEESQGTKETIS